MGREMARRNKVGDRKDIDYKRARKTEGLCKLMHLTCLKHFMRMLWNVTKFNKHPKGWNKKNSCILAPIIH